MRHATLVCKAKATMPWFDNDSETTISWRADRCPVPTESEERPVGHIIEELGLVLHHRGLEPVKDLNRQPARILVYLDHQGGGTALTRTALLVP